MISIIGHNIISPLGKTTSENLDAVRGGLSSVKSHHSSLGLPIDFVASLFSEEESGIFKTTSLTRFESLAYYSAKTAIENTDIDPTRTLFILSTTKGNISLLGQTNDIDRISPIKSAEIISGKLGLKTKPMAVDNACISGLSAIILASRLLTQRVYDYAIVCGAEEQSKFIISGFLSLKAMSESPCRPFDMERTGLNLGEAAATIVLTRNEICNSDWKIANGAVSNDAFNITAPSKTGEGAYLALSEAVNGASSQGLAFINAHGTATLFNDQMEAVAIDRVGLKDTPVNTYKGNFGHTMGACGILETILSMAAIDKGIVLPTKGFSELGVSKSINVVRQDQKTEKQSFVKMISGFGGCNAALLVSKENISKTIPEYATTISHRVRITSSEVIVDGERLETSSNGRSLLTELYKKYINDYPRFYKMDILCRLGFIASELLIKAEGSHSTEDSRDRAIVMVGKSGSIVADRRYYESINDNDSYYPSPEKFVFTLPNIVTGEIAIRNHYHGETAFYLLPDKDIKMIDDVMNATFIDNNINSILGGWLESPDEDEFEADVAIIQKEIKK